MDRTEERDLLVSHYQTMVKGKGKAEHLYSALHGTNHFKALRHGSHSF